MRRKPYQYLAIRNDITAHKAAEANLERAVHDLAEVSARAHARAEALDEANRRLVEERSRRRTHRRLEHLHAIGKLFANFESPHQTLDEALGIVVQALPISSAILIETIEERTKLIAWSSARKSSEELRAAKEHARRAHAYLVGAESTGVPELADLEGATTLPPRAPTEVLERRFVVMPLVLANRVPFGVLQLEAARRFDEADLMFVNALANQLTIALDRDRLWRAEIARRERAEERRMEADAGREVAESSRKQYESLAAENAKLYERAQQAVRLREQILAVVSHDLKNPVATVLLIAGSLAKSGPPSERDGGLAQAAGRIQRAAERMRRLIEDLLDFASIEAGSLAITRAPQDAGAMVHEILASFERIAQERRLQLTANVGPHLPKVHADRDRILQVLSNLLGNATKATAEGGSVTVSADARGNDLLFAVSDTGPGISEEDVAHLFERYWRSGSAPYRGTGLGLAIARGIVNAHGGRIWVESELGRGATFLFTIPASDGVLVQ